MSCSFNTVNRKDLVSPIGQIIFFNHVFGVNDSDVHCHPIGVVAYNVQPWFRLVSVIWPSHFFKSKICRFHSNISVFGIVVGIYNIL